MNDQTKISNHLLDLEKKLLLPENRISSEEMEELLADDFIEIRSSGTIADKRQTIKDIVNSKLQAFKLADYQCKLLSSNVALTRYSIRKSGPDQKQAINSVRSSIWQQNGNRWQMVFHQGTICKKG